jgi:geranylgeranyl diphosphate synthase type I
MGLQDSITRFQKSFVISLERFLPDNLEPKDLYSASKHLLKSGGKRLRPFLVYQSCKLVGGDVEAIMPAAVSIELIHNFTLIHDDIMDRDEFRRGVPTVHVLWGVPMAILAGDVLFSKAFEIFFHCFSFKHIDRERIVESMRRLANAVTVIAEGQALDMSFEGKLFDMSITELDYLNMIYKKTAVLIKTACEIGGLLGMGSLESVNALSKYGENIGMAFQMRDDILGVIGDEKALGKPVGSDVREGKCTLVLLHAARNCDDNQRRTLQKYYGKRDLSNIELNEVIDVLKETGSLDYVSSLAEKYVLSAKEALKSFSKGEDRDILMELADYILARGY